MVGRQRASGGGRLLLLACAVLVAAGVLAMHALVITALPSTVEGDAEHASSAVALHAEPAVEASGHGWTEPGSGGLGAHHGLLDVCLALVVALGLMVLTGAVLRLGTRVRAVDRVGHDARLVVARASAVPAPDLHALSVLRC